MTNATILGCGYVGKVVAKEWRSRNLKVTATTTTPSRVSELAAIAHHVEVLRGHDEAALHRLLSQQETLLVSIGAPAPDAYEATYDHTTKALAAVVPHLPSLTQIIYTSSYSVYGDRQGAWVTEESPAQPSHRNGEILLEAENRLLALATENRAVCILRLGGIHGPNRELVKIFRPVAGTTRPGTGEDASNWIHLDDIVGAIEFARQQSLSGLYNLVHDTPWTTRDLLDRLCDRHDLPKVSWNPSASSNRPYNARVSNQKLKAAGYSFIHPVLVV